MPLILLHQSSFGGLLVVDAFGRAQSRLLMKEVEQEAEMGQLVHPPPGDHEMSSAEESGHPLGRMVHW